MRRGMQLEALKEFILSQGASKNITLQDWEKACPCWLQSDSAACTAAAAATVSSTLLGWAELS